MPSEQDYIDSYYERTRANDSPYPPLSGEHGCEICVIGGGMAGLATALGLVERGKSVTLIEARRVAWGASGRNGGFVSPGFSLGTEALMKKVGKSLALELHQLSVEAVDLVRSRAETMADGPAPLVDGIANCSWFKDADAVKRGVEATNELLGDILEFWPREKVAEHWKSPRYYDAAFYKDRFTFHSLNFSRGIAQSAASKGATFFEQTPALSLDLTGNKKIIQTANGRVTADQVVVCCSGYINGLVPALSRATLPIGTYVVLTEPVGEKLQEAINAPYGVSDDRFAHDYYRPLPDTRILWGGRISRWTNPAQLTEIMMCDLCRVYPQLRHVKPEVSWPGTMGYAAHKMPQIGRLQDGVWYNQGHGGHGMATTTLGGELVASALADGDERWKLFEPFGLTPTAGVLGTWGVQMIYWSYQLRDQLALWKQGTKLDD